MKISERIAKLIDLKSIITMAIIGTLIYGFVSRLVPVETFVAMVSMVLAFYFAKKDTDNK
jgi:hypothetical protein